VSNGLFSAAAGLAAQQARLDAIAGDLANVNTTAYKKGRLGFRDLLYTQQAEKVWIGAGVAPVDAGRSQVQGALRETREPLNVAIEGPGFFQVRRNDGRIALTRVGEFRLDARGEVVTASGERLQPPLRFPRGVPAQLTIAKDGTVTDAGRVVGRLVVVDVRSPSALAPAGNGLFLATQESGAATPIAATAVKIHQGFVEASNVDIAEAMTAMIEAQRAFEFASRAVKLQDNLLEIANGLKR
jgi:flagellar basal-body rod protein FlgG